MAFNYEKIINSKKILKLDNNNLNSFNNLNNNLNNLNKKTDVDIIFELPMTYFKCGLCNNLEIESCKCNPSNYKCNKCNWEYITHNHKLKMLQNSLVDPSNNMHQNSLILKAIKTQK
jgi:hypothetical protein